MADTSGSFPQMLIADPKKRAQLAKELAHMFGDKIPKEVSEALEEPAKWDRCVSDVKKKGGAANPYAVCTTTVGRESSQTIQTSSMRESETKGKGKKFEVVIIEEGLGNFGDAFYYSADVINGMPDTFEGKKIYANHPSAIDEETRPERDVRDILGYFEDVKAQTIDGKTSLVANVLIPDDQSYDWARTLMREAIAFKGKHPDKEFIGISINASGDANETPIDDVIASAPASAKPKLIEAKSKGIETVRVVTAITDAVSADLVTEAGAGGKIIKLMEGDKDMSKKEDAAPADKKHDDADQDKALIGDMIKKHMGKDGGDPTEDHHEMYQAMADMGHGKEEAAKMACAAVKAMAAQKQKKEAKEAADKEAKEAGDPSTMTASKEADHEEDMEKKEKKESSVQLAGRVAFLEGELKKASLEKYVDTKLAKAGLPRSTTDLIRESIGTVKSEKDFDHKYELFMKGFKHQKESTVSFGFMPEKIVTSGESQGLDLSECVKI